MPGTPHDQLVSQEAQSRATPTTAQLLQILRDNFVVISGLAVIFGVGLATIFLAAYLTVFDWHLLWFVQYTDILTFGLIAAGVISGSLLFLQGAVQAVLSWFKLDAWNKRIALIVVCLLIVGFVVFNVWGSVREGQGYFHILLGVLLLAFGVIVIVRIIGHAISRALPTAGQFTSLMILLGLIAIYCGQWLGYSVLESGTLLDVNTKNGTMTHVKLIIVMSRDTILLKDKNILVVPTGDIAQFQSALPPWALP